MWTALLPPVLCRKGLTSGKQTDLCVKDENALKVYEKTHRIPDLLESPTFCQAARCKVQMNTLISPTLDLLLPGLLPRTLGSKKVLHHHHWKQKENPNFFSCSQACMYLLALFHVMVLHLAKEKHFYYLHYCYYYLRRSMCHFQFSLYSRVTQFLIHRYWHSVLFLVSSLLIPNSQGWWSNFSLDNAIQFSVLTTKRSGAESTNGNSVLVSTELLKMLKVAFILIVLKAFEVNMGWRIPYYEDPIYEDHSSKLLKWPFYKCHVGWEKGCHPSATCKIVAL